MGLAPALQARFRIEQRFTSRWLESFVEAYDIGLGRRALLRLLRVPKGSRDEMATVESALLAWAEESAASPFFHPKILDFGKTTFRDAPAVYLVCDWLNGQRLGDRVRDRGPMLPHEALGVASELMTLLRDRWQADQRPHLGLNPLTVLLKKTDTGHEVQLDAWGLLETVRPHWPALASQPNVEALWLAPEQRKATDWGPRTDIWAVGQLLRFLLTGLEPSPFGTIPIYGPVQVLVDTLTADEPAQRPASYADALELIRGELPKVSGPRTVVATPRQALRLAPILGATLLAGLLVGTAVKLAADHLMGDPQSSAQAASTAPDPLVFVALECAPRGAIVRDAGTLLGACPLPIAFEGPSAPRRQLDISAPGYAAVHVEIGPLDGPKNISLSPLPESSEGSEPAPLQPRGDSRGPDRAVPEDAGGVPVAPRQDPTIGSANAG